MFLATITFVLYFSMIIIILARADRKFIIGSKNNKDEITEVFFINIKDVLKELDKANDKKTIKRIISTARFLSIKDKAYLTMTIARMLSNRFRKWISEVCDKACNNIVVFSHVMVKTVRIQL